MSDLSFSSFICLPQLIGITKAGSKFSNLFDLNYTWSGFRPQTFLAWVTLAEELNLQTEQLCRLQVIEARKLFHLVKMMVNGKTLPYYANNAI